MRPKRKERKGKAVSPPIPVIIDASWKRRKKKKKMGKRVDRRVFSLTKREVRTRHQGRKKRTPPFMGERKKLGGKTGGRKKGGGEGPSGAEKRRKKA